MDKLLGINICWVVMLFQWIHLWSCVEPSLWGRQILLPPCHCRTDRQTRPTTRSSWAFWRRPWTEGWSACWWLSLLIIFFNRRDDKTIHKQIMYDSFCLFCGHFWTLTEWNIVVFYYSVHSHLFPLAQLLFSWWVERPGLSPLLALDFLLLLQTPSSWLHLHSKITETGSSTI